MRTHVHVLATGVYFAYARLVRDTMYFANALTTFRSGEFSERTRFVHLCVTVVYFTQRSSDECSVIVRFSFVYSDFGLSHRINRLQT